MVYLGPSRGCTSCKLRRKKCDETRPSCSRCLRAGRVCGGYEADPSSAFRQYTAKDKPPVFKSMARKCTLPSRDPTPGSDTLPADGIPVEISLTKSNEFALRAFIWDYCAASDNPNMSRGYLAGLEWMVRSAGPKSDLARACQAVSCAAHGKPSNRACFTDRAEEFHHELLGSMAKAMQSHAAADSGEYRMIAMLLGLYQIVVPPEGLSSTFDAHSKGLAALMRMEHTPLSLLREPTTKSSGPNTRSGVFSVPALNTKDARLDKLLLDVHKLWTRFEINDELTDTMNLWDEVLALNQRFQQWQTSRPPEFLATTSGRIQANAAPGEYPAGCWPGKVDIYFDLYVAGVWNVFRSARMLLLALSLELSRTLGCESAALAYASSTAQTIVDDLLASIPYHLVDNLQLFLQENTQNKTGITDPGRRLGGLLLLHPLHVLCRMPFVAEDAREYAKGCLKWISSNMGFGQAAALAEDMTVERDYLASAWMIIWSGFLM